jgi:Raf kinase inhibitor-like YbhB/YbcL family protein
MNSCIKFRIAILLPVLTLACAQLADADQNFAVTSPVMADGGALPTAQVFNGFGCQGANLSPPLAWTAPPAGTKSLAITMFDPDAPVKGGWWHWTVFNLPPGTRAVSEAEGAPGAKPLPDGAIQVRNDFGTPGYGGACPPAGQAPHHYVITIWALNVPALPLDARAPGVLVSVFIDQHAIGKATLTVLYGR